MPMPSKPDPTSKSKIREGSPNGIRKTTDESESEKDMWNRWVVSLEWKVEQVIDGESAVNALITTKRTGKAHDDIWKIWTGIK